MKPEEKWGKPAANDIRVGMSAPDDGPWYSWGDRAGSEAVRDRPTNWREPSERALRNDEPFWTKLKKMEILNYTDGTVFSSKRWYHKMNFKASTRPLEKLHRKRNNKPWHLAPSSIQKFKIKRGYNGVKVTRHQISWTFLDQTENLVKPYTQLQV